MAGQRRASRPRRKERTKGRTSGEALGRGKRRKERASDGTDDVPYDDVSRLRRPASMGEKERKKSHSDGRREAPEGRYAGNAPQFQEQRDVRPRQTRVKTQSWRRRRRHE